MPLTLDKYWQLIEYVTEGGCERGVSRTRHACCYGDAAAFAALWEFGQRVEEVGPLGHRRFLLSEHPMHGSVGGHLLGEVRPPTLPCSWRAVTGTKIDKEKHPGTYSVRKAVSEDGCGVLLAILPGIRSCDGCSRDSADGVADSGGDRPPIMGRFEQVPLSTSARQQAPAISFAGRWGVGRAKLPTASGVGAPKILHARGMSEKCIMRLRQWRTEKTLRRYLHTTRHKTRLRPVPVEGGDGHEDQGSAKRSRR